MTRIFRRDVHLTPDTTVAAWDPHNGFGDVNVKDVYLIQLKDVDFKGRGYRNLVIPEKGYVTVYKTEQGYQVVDAGAEADIKKNKQAELEATADDKVEKVLDEWDDVMVADGYSYVGEDEQGYIWYVATKSIEEQPCRALHIDTKTLRNNFTKSDSRKKWALDVFTGYYPEPHKVVQPEYYPEERLTQSSVGRKVLQLLGNPDDLADELYSNTGSIPAKEAWPEIKEEIVKHIERSKKNVENLIREYPNVYPKYPKKNQD